MTPIEKIEILPVSLLDENRSTVEELKRLTYSLGLDFGWHYLLDLTWIIRHLGQPEGKRIMDAGAGTGVIQWYLASHGAEVLSVDRASRALLRSIGFREVGTYERHGKLDGNWRDVVIVERLLGEAAGVG